MERENMGRREGDWGAWENHKSNKERFIEEQEAKDVATDLEIAQAKEEEARILKVEDLEEQATSWGEGHEEEPD